MLRYVKNENVNYDDLCFLNLSTENGLCGRVVQDVVTQPVRKVAIFQGSLGTLTLHVNYDSSGDAIVVHKTGEEPELIRVSKTRPDDFIEELKHIDSALTSSTLSPIALERGLDTMLVVSAAHQVNACGKRATLNPTPTYKPSDIQF